MPKRMGKIRGYQAVLAAITAVNQLRDEIRNAREGFGEIGIPRVSLAYTAEIHKWLLGHKETLEEELGLAATMDQYGNSLLYRCPECASPHVLRDIHVDDTAFDGLLIYGTCQDCGKLFVSRGSGRDFEEAA